MIRFAAIILFLIVTSYAYSQETMNKIVPADIFQKLATPSSNGGKVILHEASEIKQLMLTHTAQNQKIKSFTGYRIQILSANTQETSMQHIRQQQSDFEQTFPEIPIYLKYSDPNFNIRVGNFRTRLESIPTLQLIRKKYPNSYPVKTEISFEELKKPIRVQPETDANAEVEETE